MRSTLLALLTLLALTSPAHADDANDTGVASGATGFAVSGTKGNAATETTGPGVAIEQAQASLGDEGTWIQSTNCNSYGGAGCYSYNQCADGSLAEYWAYTLPSGAVEASYDQCATDPAPTEPDAPPALPALTPGRILQAFRQVPLPESTIAVQPPGGETLVNFETIYSTEAEPFTETVRLLGRSVTLDISPASFTWHHGDGTTQTTDWAGRPWTKGMSQQQVVAELIHHVYTRKGKDIPASVDTVWTARYRVNDGPWADVGGTVTMTGSPVTLDVLEARPVLTAG